MDPVVIRIYEATISPAFRCQPVVETFPIRILGPRGRKEIVVVVAAVVSRHVGILGSVLERVVYVGLSKARWSGQIPYW